MHQNTAQSSPAPTKLAGGQSQQQRKQLHLQRLNLDVTVHVDPENVTEMGRLLEEAVLYLPTPYRTVIMLRDIDELSTADVAGSRSSLRACGAELQKRLPLYGANYDRAVLGVFGRLRELDSES